MAILPYADRAASGALLANRACRGREGTAALLPCLQYASYRKRCILSLVFPQFSDARGCEKLGRFSESLRFFWPQTQGPKDFLGVKLRAKATIFRAFRVYPFHGRADSSQVGENWLLEESRDGEFFRRFVDINRPEFVDLS